MHSKVAMAPRSFLRLYLGLRDFPQDHLMTSKDPIGRGQRYRDLSAGRFGVLGTEWIVDAIFLGTDGIQYAQLVNARDLTQHKTLAVDVLGDSKRFERV
jgi:hypothetical protein